MKKNFCLALLWMLSAINLLKAQYVYGPLMEHVSACYVEPEMNFYYKSVIRLKIKNHKFTGDCECRSQIHETAYIKKIGKRRLKGAISPSLSISRESILQIQKWMSDFPYFYEYPINKPDMLVYAFQPDDSVLSGIPKFYDLYMGKKYQEHSYSLRLTVYLPEGDASIPDIAYYEEILRQIEITALRPKHKKRR